MNFRFWSKRTTYSSRLIESAYAAGQHRRGVRGDELFEVWLDLAKLNFDLHSAFIRQLRTEYFRGVEAQMLKAEKPAKPVPAATSQTFRSHRIEAIDGGEYIVPTLDRESRFEDLKQAKRFIAAYAR